VRVPFWGSWRFYICIFCFDWTVTAITLTKSWVVFLLKWGYTRKIPTSTALRRLYWILVSFFILMFVLGVRHLILCWGLQAWFYYLGLQSDCIFFYGTNCVIFNGFLLIRSQSLLIHFEWVSYCRSSLSHLLTFASSFAADFFEICSQLLESTFISPIS
jgi:hypothetical protein